MPLVDDRGDARLLNLLIAYPYCTPNRVENLRGKQDELRLLVDSGAFTAWKQGTAITLDAYCDFLEKLPLRVWRYFMLDVIGNAEATRANYHEMLRRGFTPIPIFTRGEDPAVLDEYFATSDLVGIGGLVGTQGNRGFVNGIMQRVGGRRVHWLGFGKIDFVKTYRPYSCDSTSWVAGRFGQIALYMGNGQFVSFTQQFCRKHALPEEWRSRLGYYGIDPDALRTTAAWNGDGILKRPARKATMRGWLQASVEVERYLGTKIFCAIASMRDIDALFDAWEFVNGLESSRCSVGRTGQHDLPVLDPAPPAA